MVLFTGKGGVGKTSIAAATAVVAARRGSRVLLTSTDPAHSLADALDTPVGDRPTGVQAVGAPEGPGRLLAQQLDAQGRLQRDVGQVRSYLSAVLSRSGVDRVVAEELVALPGLQELFALVELSTQVATGDHDLVVVDCAPTAETLKLLTLPEVVRFYTARLRPPAQAVSRALAPLVGTRADASDGLPAPDAAIRTVLSDLQRDLATLQGILTDTERSSVRLVANPERIVLAETARTATSLALFGYGTDAVVLNRVLPEAVTDPYLARWRDRHREQVRAAHEAFQPTPVLTVPLLEDEVVGVDALARLGTALYGEGDPAAVLHRRPLLEVVEDGPDLTLRVALPFAVEDDLALSRRRDRLQVTVGALRRNLDLPAALRPLEVQGARLHAGHLEVRFAAARTGVAR